MPNYQVVDADQLDADITLVADSIRAKGGTSDALSFPVGLINAVNAIQIGGLLQDKTVTPKETTQTITPDDGYDALSSVTVIGVTGGVLAQNEKKYQFGTGTSNYTFDTTMYLDGAYGVLLE